METRICKVCGKELPITDFMETGKGETRMRVCKTCLLAKRNLTRKKNEKASYIDMSTFGDEILFAELRKRGYSGQLELSKTVTV